jgi:UDP-GlcNAc:undecaprenyl-phosphate GlcNAc-1-phosphate transferase
MASLPIVLGCKIAALYASGLYQRSWEPFGLRDLTVVGRGVAVGSAALGRGGFYLYRGDRVASRVVFVLDAILLAIAIIATRVSFRMMNLAAATRKQTQPPRARLRAGNFGRMLCGRCARTPPGT